MLDLYTDIEYLELLGNRVKDQRLNRNISQLEMADFCGVNRRTISLFENGKGIHLISFIRILRKLDMDEFLIDFIPELSNIDPFKTSFKKRERAS